MVFDIQSKWHVATQVGSKKKKQEIHFHLTYIRAYNFIVYLMCNDRKDLEKICMVFYIILFMQNILIVLWLS